MLCLSIQKHFHVIKEKGLNLMLKQDPNDHIMNLILSQKYLRKSKVKESASLITLHTLISTQKNR